MTEWTDDFFLGYVALHAETERALFSPEHVRRLHELAGEPVPEVSSFVAMHTDYVKPRIAKARERLKKQESGT
jgi:hypothetical protein